MVSAGVLAVLVVLQFPDNGLGKAVEDGPSARATAFPHGTPGKVTGSWLKPGLAPVIVAVQRANQLIKNFFLSLSSSFLPIVILFFK